MFLASYSMSHESPIHSQIEILLMTVDKTRTGKSKGKATEAELRIVSNLRKHATDISDSLVLASLVVSEIGEWGPVGRLVSSHGTGGAVGSGQSIVVSNVAETCIMK